MERTRVEAKLLETEKKNNDLSVDLIQLQKQNDDLKGNLHHELDKVQSPHLRQCYRKKLHSILSRMSTGVIVHVDVLIWFVFRVTCKLSQVWKPS